MEIPQEILAILVCPVCKTSLEQLQDGKGLKCSSCKRVYAIKDEIPGMLAEDATIAQD